MTMRAARLFGKNDLRLVALPVPDIGEGDILLRAKAAAVCGTDLRMLQNGAAGVDESHPLTLCHEFSGVVESVGVAVRGYAPGDRVSVAPNVGCGVCDRCVRGHSHHCNELYAFGVHVDGGFAEFVKIPEKAVRLGNVTRLVESVSFEAAAAAEAFSCAYSAFERYAPRPGDTVLIIGAGAIGLMHAKLCLMAGAARVILNDISQARLDECRAIEPELTYICGDLSGEVSRITGGRGCDVVITACSAPAAQKAAFALAALDGRVNFFGGLPKGRENIELDTNVIHYKQLSVTGTTRSSHFHYRRALELTGKGLIKLDPLITHRFALQDVNKAFDNAARAVGLKQCIVF